MARDGLQAAAPGICRQRQRNLVRGERGWSGSCTVESDPENDEDDAEFDSSTEDGIK